MTWVQVPAGAGWPNRRGRHAPNRGLRLGAYVPFLRAMLGELEVLVVARRRDRSRRCDSVGKKSGRRIVAEDLLTQDLPGSDDLGCVAEAERLNAAPGPQRLASALRRGWALCWPKHFGKVTFYDPANPAAGLSALRKRATATARAAGRRQSRVCRSRPEGARRQWAVLGRSCYERPL